MIGLQCFKNRAL